MPTMHTVPTLFLITLALNTWGFSNIAPGDALPEKSLNRIGGSPQKYLAKSKVTVFFFFTPGTKNSQLALRKLAELEKELAGKPVAWVGLVSGSVAVADAQQDAADAKLAAPLLRDEGDALYGALGTALTPVVGIADEQHRLLAYLPFNKLQYQDAIRAWVRFGLGELDKAQLELALTPPPLATNGELEVARRFLKMAQKQRDKGDFEKATASTRKSLEHVAELPAANAMLGSILAAQGKCADARPALEAALVGDPNDELAQATMRACAGGDAGTPEPSARDGGAADAGP